MLLACPTAAFASMLEGVGWVEMRWRCHFTRLSQQKPKEMDRDVLEVLWTQQAGKQVLHEPGSFQERQSVRFTWKCLWRAPFVQQDTLGMMTSAASLDWLSVLGTADEKPKHQWALIHAHTNFLQKQSGVLTKLDGSGKKRSSPNPREKVLKPQAVAVRGWEGSGTRMTAEANIHIYICNIQYLSYCMSPRSTNNYSYREHILWQKLSWNKFWHRDVFANSLSPEKLKSRTDTDPQLLGGSVEWWLCSNYLPIFCPWFCCSIQTASS